MTYLKVVFFSVHFHYVGLALPDKVWRRCSLWGWFKCDKEAASWGQEGLGALEERMGSSALQGLMLLSWIIIISTCTTWRMDEQKRKKKPAHEEKWN